MSRDYKRHGAIDLFPGMSVANGEILYDTSRLQKATDVLAFLELVDLYMPRDLEVHVVLHSFSAHKAEPILRWLAHRRSARWHSHFTPTSPSSLNLLEGRFFPLTEPRLPRAFFNTVDDLLTALETLAEHRNNDLKSFRCKKPADKILSTVTQRCSTPTQVTSTTHQEPSLPIWEGPHGNTF
jgi:hypothetical protein